MPIFSFEAMDAKGKKTRQEVEAENLEDAKNRIRAMNLFPTKVKELAGKKAPASPSARGASPKKRKAVIGGVSNKELSDFTSQLSTLQNAGLPIVRSLKILEKQMKPSKLKYQVEDVAEDVEGGSTFSDALAKHPRTFDKLYVNMVKAGEAGGVLDTILDRLATFMEKSLRLRKKVQGASIYPIVILLVAAVILVVIFMFVIPKFQAMFKDMGTELPAVTTLLISIADFAVNFWYILIFVPVLLVVGIIAMSKSAGGKMFLDRVKLKLPVVGPVIRKSVISRFTRTLGTLISSGVPILEALSIIKEAVGNEVIAKAVDDVHGSIKEGESIADPLRASGVFDEVLVNMIEVGEETGELDKMLMKISDNYDNEVDVTVDSMTSIIEPILLVSMGVVVGFIVIALFLPLVGLMDKIGGGS